MFVGKFVSAGIRSIAEENPQPTDPDKATIIIKITLVPRDKIIQIHNKINNNKKTK